MDFMEAITTEIERRKQSIDYRKDTITSIDNSLKTIDRVLDSYPKLVTEEYRGWHANQIKRLGTSKYIELADRAMKYGRNPQALFSTMLKKY